MDNNINDNGRLYVKLIRGFDPCIHTREWQNFSEAKYTLPDYFQDPTQFGSALQSDRWYIEVATHVGETFNYQWMPVGKAEVWHAEEPSGNVTIDWSFLERYKKK